jgi:hypothetical protein
MDGVPGAERQARFTTACAWVDPQPEKTDYPVLAPAARRWLRNPWGRNLGYMGEQDEWEYWNGLEDRRKVWQAYRRQMESDLVDWGHDRQRLLEVARGLFAGCPDALRPGEKLDEALAEQGMRLPDSRIWSVTGPGTAEEAPSRFAPSGLPADAPGLNRCGEFWVEITARGKILGRITEQPVGRSGFGYDPVFRPETETRTLAEMPAEDKNGLSHRGKAMRRLLRAVRGAY